MIRFCLIFLAYSERCFKELGPQLQAKASARRPVTPDDYPAKGVLYVPDVALFDYLVHLPEGADVGTGGRPSWLRLTSAGPLSLC